MSYTTRCPACGTTFRVVPDQLKISDGWVRCGYCADVFDATLYLQEWPDQDVAPAQTASVPRAPSRTQDQAEQAQVPAAVAGGEASPASEADVLDQEDSGWQDSDFLADLQRYARRARGEETDAPAQAPGPAPTPAPEDPLPDAPAVPDEEPAPQPTPPVTPVPESPAVAPSEAPAARVNPDHDPTVPEEPVLPGFVVQARRRAFWSSPAVRVALVLFAVLLGGLLAIQWAWHERDQVAARWPAARPLLQSACNLAGCEIAPVRRIDDVVIDSSQLSRRLGTFYVFDLVLQNKAEVPVAVPALELSLTDARDQVLSRRVFLARELPGSPVVLPARGSLELTLNLSISLADSSAMSGYRALLFYP